MKKALRFLLVSACLLGAASGVCGACKMSFEPFSPDVTSGSCLGSTLFTQDLVKSSFWSNYMSNGGPPDPNYSLVPYQTLGLGQCTSGVACWPAFFSPTKVIPPLEARLCNSGSALFLNALHIHNLTAKRAQHLLDDRIAFPAVSRMICFSRRSASSFEGATSAASPSLTTKRTPRSLPVTSLQTSRKIFMLSLFASVSRKCLVSGANSMHSSLPSIDARRAPSIAVTRNIFRLFSSDDLILPISEVSATPPVSAVVSAKPTLE